MFKEFGYFKEYYVDKKFIGFINSEKDREEIGYYGKRKEILETTVELSNGKKIKSGKEVETILYPLCGKVQK